MKPKMEFDTASLAVIGFDIGKEVFHLRVTGTPRARARKRVGVLYEREMMLERQREGIAKAKSEGKYKGRAPTAQAKATEARGPGRRCASRNTACRHL